MECLGNTPTQRDRPLGENDLQLTPGGLIFGLFGRIFWLFGRGVRLTSIPIQAGIMARCRLSCRALGMSYNLHYVK
jgi:hypothetical protein